MKRVVWWVACLIVGGGVSMVGCGNDDAAPGSPMSNGTTATNNGTSTGGTVGTTGGTTASNTTTPTSNTTTGCMPVEEICDEADNDCDGRVDEGLTSSDVNNCGACGQVCERTNASTVCQAGACILVACEEGFVNADNNPDNGCERSACEPTNAGVEACDEVDNDCDGEVDEDFGVGESLNHCLGCNTPCDLDNASAVCGAGACLVDACDEGWLDEDEQPENGCEAEVCMPTNGGVEGCDGVDNDCDGEVDEDFDFTSPLTCGSCTLQCEIEHGVAGCDAGICTFEGCDDGWFDLNDDLETDGCEYLCEATDRADEEITCDGQDNDCDGEIDEGSGDGVPCMLGDTLEGTLECDAEGGLSCRANPTDEEFVDLCGAVAGVLTAEGGPYRINCNEVLVEGGTELVVEQGAEIYSGFAAPVTVVVQGELTSMGATWTGVTLRVQTSRGGATLLGDTLVTNSGGQVLINIPDASQTAVVAEDVTLDGAGRPGTGIVVQGAGVPQGAFSWSGGSVRGLTVGVQHEASGALELDGVVVEEVRTGFALEGAAALVVSDAIVRNASGADAVGFDLSGLDGAPDVTLQNVTFEQRSRDAAIKLDPDWLGVVTLSEIAVGGDELPGVHLVGDLDELDELVLAPLGGALSAFVPVGTVTVVEAATLRGDDAVSLRGVGDSLLRVNGALELTDTSLDDVAVEVEATGSATLDGVTMTLTGLRAVACLVTVQGSGELELLDATLLGQQDSGGVCIEAVDEAPFLTGTRIENFGQGVVARNLGARAPLSDMTLHDNALGILVQGLTAPLVFNNTFSSSADQQIVALRFDVGANPGGQVSSNTFDLDIGDLAYHIDPDNLATDGGTVFGPNTWADRQPESILMSGRQTSEEVSLYAITELDPLDEPFLTVQIPDNVEVSAGTRLLIAPQDFQIWTLQGLRAAPGETYLQVRGELEIEGQGVIVSDLPILFEANSTGSISRTTLISNRADLAMVEIADAAPIIGGEGSVSACSFTGSNTRDGTGVRISASRPMCVDGAICPFIAENQFRNLAIGIDVASGDFRGVNDFDDANPNEDTVPINVRRQ